MALTLSICGERSSSFMRNILGVICDVTIGKLQVQSHLAMGLFADLWSIQVRYKYGCIVTKPLFACGVVW